MSSKLAQMSLSSLADLLRLLAEFGSETFHLVVERFAVVLDLRGSDVAAWREDVAVMADVFQCCCLAEAGHVLVSCFVSLSPRQAW